LKNSLTWRDQFIRTFLERDNPELGTRLPSAVLGDACPLPRSAVERLHLWVVYPGKDSYPLHPAVTVISIEDLPSVQDKVA
jgi:hypothetical protein